MRKKLLFFSLLCSLTGIAQSRQELLLQDDWQFSRDKKNWQTVSVPHDWAISGPFDKKWDLQTVAITQNGETQATEKSGRSGALPWIGEGYYKRTFNIPTGFKGAAELVFDGAMAQPTVSINGQNAGFWAYGYNTFRIDITPYIKEGDNLLEVSLKNQEESSRWYPGAGIYRPVTLILTPQQARIDDWGITTRTELHAQRKNGKDYTKLVVEVPIINAGQGLPVTMELISPDNKSKKWVSPAPMKKGAGKAVGTFIIPDALLWTPETPNLYKLRITLCDGNSDPNVYDDFGKAIDQKTIKVGLRSVRVSKEKGFQLNGETRKLKGVCLHHDLGPLGAAVNKAALIRQIKILKEMGCDAIRTAHNMPSQWQMDVCDSLGMMVMAESFDMWIYPKCKNGYAQFFKEWADKDITNLVKANRNHPSIVMWSIGNEIPEQGSEEGRQIAIRLQGLCHSLDPTRPVTQGMDRVDNAMNSGFAQAMEVPGLNYRLHRYQAAYDRLQHGFLLGSETASTVSSRGTYYFPVTPTDRGIHPDGQCSGYDVEWCSWSNLPDDDWVWQDDKDWVIGEFVWTGFDYLGEPTPYDEYWPSRSSYFGICDLAGLPKDRYYLYRSKWNKKEHTIHLLPHWTWGKDRIGQVTPVYCYTDYDEAELFVNGKSQGRIKKNPKERLDRYRLRWNEVKYEPGEVKVVVYDANGNAAGEQVIKTAGKPAALKTEVWTQTSNLKADGNDLAYVTVNLVDKNGTLIPDATDQLTFEVSGAGTFRGVCNGDATSVEVFTQPTMKLFAGQLVVVVQASNKKGQLTLIIKDNQRKLTQKVLIPVN
jgi:beta-galactosidase